jgi:hypothetical protein
MTFITTRHWETYELTTITVVETEDQLHEALAIQTVCTGTTPAGIKHDFTADEIVYIGEDPPASIEEVEERIERGELG